MKGILAAFILFFYCLSPAFSVENEPELNLIKNLEVHYGSDSEQLQIVFEKDYRQTTSLSFDPGKLTLILPLTKFDQKLTYQRINDKFVKDIRLLQEGRYTIAEIHFADTSFMAVGLVEEKPLGKTFFLNVFKDDQALTTAQQALGVKKAMEPTSDKLADQGKLKLFDQKDPDLTEFTGGITTYNIVKMLIGLFLILLFFYLLLVVYNKFFVSKFNFNKGKYKIRISSSFHISPKQKIVILEINDQAYACGITNNYISVISKVSPEGFSDFLTRYNPSQKQTVDFSELREQYLSLRQKQEKMPEPQKQPKGNFAAELFDRVKNLKPID